METNNFKCKAIVLLNNIKYASIIKCNVIKNLVITYTMFFNKKQLN